jgi:2-methylisoborneol synthase
MSDTTIQASGRLRAARLPPTAETIALSERIEASLHGWLAGLDLLPVPCGAVTSYSLGRFAISCYGEHVEEGRLSLAARYFAALFILDDHYCDDDSFGSSPVLLGERLTLLLAVIDPVVLRPGDAAAFHAAVTSDPVLAVWRAFMAELDQVTTFAQRGRIRHEITNMLLSMAGEASWRMAGKMPPGWEYAVNRQFNGALPCTALIDVVGGYELSPRWYYDPRIRRCSILAGNAVMIANDFFSMAKEARTRSQAYNLAGVIGAERAYAAAEASQHNVMFYDKAVEAFEAARRELAPEVSADVMRYLEGLDRWVTGSIDWYQITRRYNAKDGWDGAI